MPNRIVRDGILSSERVDRLSPAAEVTYRRLMSVVDDFGRYSAHPSLIRAGIYPLRIDRVTDDEVAGHLRDCEGAGLIQRYEVAGKPYLEIADFRQRTRAMSSKWPSPDRHPTDKRRSHDGHMTVNGLSNGGHPRTETETETEAESETEAFDPSDLAESLYGRHPKKAGKVLAEQALAEALASSADPRRLAMLMEERHAAWCSSHDWRKDGGRFAPKLFDWIRNQGWLDDPPETVGDPGDLPEWKGIPDAY